MRKVILKMEMSLDGYVEGPNGQMDWFVTETNEQWDEIFSYLNNVDTVLAGRGMFAGYAEYWKSVLTNPDANPNHLKFARWAEKTPHIVFSKTVKQFDWENTTVNSGDLKEEIVKIKQQPGKDIIIWGGASFAAACIENGLIDELRFIINPVILGGGKSPFRNLHKQQKLTLISNKTLPGTAAVTFSAHPPHK